MASTTVPGRRAVRRRARPTIDAAYEKALAELRPLLPRYVDNIREGQEIRSALCTVMTRTGMRCYDVDRIARSLS
jgi:hypothetical protein